MVVEISLSPELAVTLANALSAGVFNAVVFLRRAGKKPPSSFLRSIMYCISGESSAGL